MKCVSYLGISFLDLIFFPEHLESNPFLSGWFYMDKHRAGYFLFLLFLPIFVDSLNFLFSFFYLYSEAILLLSVSQRRSMVHLLEKAGILLKTHIFRPYLNCIKSNSLGGEGPQDSAFH